MVITSADHQNAAHRHPPRASRLWDRITARAFAQSLDRQLAAGSPSGSSPALAIRADRLVSADRRRALVRAWVHVLDEVQRPPLSLSPRGPLCRGRILDAEREIRAMVMVVDGALPITARGAAMSRLLLTDGIGPLHNPRSAADLGTAVREATSAMRRRVDQSA
jgi:hypothetical protein